MEHPELVKQAQSGDTAAFGQIYDDFAGRIFRYVHLKVNNRQQAEDILQEVFIKAWRALPKFDGEHNNFSAWLYKIATNATNDYFRKIYRSPHTLELTPDIDAINETTSAEDITRMIDLENIKKVLGSLPQQYRQVLELRFIQDFTLQETADILDKSNLAIRLIQHRALKKLREMMGKQYANSYSKI